MTIYNNMVHTVGVQYSILAKMGSHGYNSNRDKELVRKCILLHTWTNSNVLGHKYSTRVAGKGVREDVQRYLLWIVSLGCHLMTKTTLAFFELYG
jgi:hypothetical protein